MITIERDSNFDEVFIHAAPEDLRFLAKKLWAISEKAEANGEHSEQLSSDDYSEIELSTKPKLDNGKNTVVKKLTISSSV
jgi:hypothetical protein